jgi:hypothetical protein
VPHRVDEEAQRQHTLGAGAGVQRLQSTMPAAWWWWWWCFVGSLEEEKENSLGLSVPALLFARSWAGPGASASRRSKSRPGTRRPACSDTSCSARATLSSSPAPFFCRDDHQYQKLQKKKK